MTSNTIAEGIVKKFASYTKGEETTEASKSEKVVRATIVDVLGYSMTAVGKNQKEAGQQLADAITKDLDNGDLQLSDTWAEDNLEA